MVEEYSDDRNELERAIDYLKAAEKVHEPDKYVPSRQDGAIELVDNAIDEISNFIDSETERVEENTLFNNGEID